MPSKIDVFVIASSMAPAIEPMASVPIKDGMPRMATETPLASPVAPPARSANSTAAHGGGGSEPNDEADREVELADHEDQCHADCKHGEHRRVVEDRARVRPCEEDVRALEG